MVGAGKFTGKVVGTKKKLPDTGKFVGAKKLANKSATPLLPELVTGDWCRPWWPEMGKKMLTNEMISNEDVDYVIKINK